MLKNKAQIARESIKTTLASMQGPGPLPKMSSQNYSIIITPANQTMLIEFTYTDIPSWLNVIIRVGYNDSEAFNKCFQHVNAY